MKDLSKFQLILIIFLSISIVAGLIVLSLSRGSSKERPLGRVVMWGTENQVLFNSFLADTFKSDKTLQVTYVEKSKANFDQSLVEAIADGVGPDVVLLPESSILRYKNKISPIPYTSYSARNYKDTFVQEAEMFLFPEGVVALPWSIDPLVMYWNRDLFANQGIAKPPRYWDEFLDLPNRLTIKNQANGVTQSAVALGEFGNIVNAKQIISALFLQLGNPIVSIEPVNGLKATLGDGSLVSALRFYTDFSNSTRPVYSWNLSLQADKVAFISGKLAVYFGFASELRDIRDKNPNLNFDVTYFPQLRDGTERVTFGSLEGLAVLQSSKNKNGAFSLLGKLSGTDNTAKWANLSLLPPARRDLLSTRPSDPFYTVFYDSALWARGWLDPQYVESSDIFASMIEAVKSGRLSYSQALSQAANKMQVLLNTLNK